MRAGPVATPSRRGGSGPGSRSARPRRGYARRGHRAAPGRSSRPSARTASARRTRSPSPCPTYQSAWLKAHHPAAFYAGLLTHDPGMYPKRLLLADARRRGVPVLPLDVNRSAVAHRIELVSGASPAGGPAGPARWGLRLALSDVHGISEAEARADRGRAALRLAARTSGSGPGRAARSPNGSPRSARWTPSAPTGATCCCTSPNCTATGGRRRRPRAAGQLPLGGRDREQPTGRARGPARPRRRPNGSAPSWASSAWTPPAI